MADAFSTFGLPLRFNIDETALQRRFIELSAQHHPDRFSDPLDQADAAEESARINEAYRTLKDPESRANALLEALGGSGKSDDKTLPPDLLMDMMELRERQQEAQAADDRATLAELHAQAQSKRQEHLATVARLFEQAMASTPADPEKLKAIRVELNALRYIERMIEQLPR
jgi:molecular chaperone HscB